MQERDAAWLWSEAFGEAVGRSMLDPPLVAAERLDWPKFCDRLAQWWRDVEEARKEHLQGHPGNCAISTTSGEMSDGRMFESRRCLLATTTLGSIYGGGTHAPLCNHKVGRPWKGRVLDKGRKR